MEGASSGLAGHINDILPKDVQFVLAWNTQQFRTEGDSGGNVIQALPTRGPPDTASSAFRSTATFQAAFYDRHLAPHVILERVVYLDTLVSTMSNTVDQAIQDAVAKRPLPENPGVLLPKRVIEQQHTLTRRTKRWGSWKPI